MDAKKCPLCGGTPDICNVKPDWSCSYHWMIECRGDEAKDDHIVRAIGDTYNEVFEVWNKRVEEKHANTESDKDFEAGSVSLGQKEKGSDGSKETCCEEKL